MSLNYTFQSLNWTPKPFQGDIDITWRYEFLSCSITPGMTTRMLSYCRNHCPTQAVYHHYWTDGVLMKMGQVSQIVKTLIKYSFVSDALIKVHLHKRGYAPIGFVRQIHGCAIKTI